VASPKTFASPDPAGTTLRQSRATSKGFPAAKAGLANTSKIDTSKNSLFMAYLPFSDKELETLLKGFYAGVEDLDLSQAQA
jgi:hypothetical protein